MLFQKPYPNNLDLAGENTRINNFIIDFFISFTLGFSAAKAIELIDYNEWLPFIAFMLVRFVYYFVPEMNNGKTIGKMITKSRVVDINGNQPSGPKLIKRTLLRFISLLLTFISDENVAFHDQFSKTYVVNDR
ncbi:RDD family protein [Spongiivirga citrea]|uniref:RDD domain-containing protein n=1 Tax=Spongiivirga citrea TaxID=1481457 RepID=A0A6M0CR49_9FLAO|nr:RDD family protein [Spongiivirga citrea]NER17997.1 hypothetical protein [Spongiivirga citrea]